MPDTPSLAAAQTQGRVRRSLVQNWTIPEGVLLRPQSPYIIDNDDPARRVTWDECIGGERVTEEVPAPVDPQPMPTSPRPVPNNPAPTPHPIRRRRIKAVGVELEGGWDRRPPAEMHRDGSVTVDAPIVGEISSPPIPDFSTAEEWMRANYPHRVNSSCGLHVHVSTNELNYGRLMEPEFAQFFECRMAEFLSQGLADNRPGFDLLRQRFQGLNRYCQKKFIPEQQLFMTDRYGDVNTHPRYAQLNFCYIRHGTLECRLFPCFPNVDDGVAAVKAFYDTVFDYLGQFKSTKDEPSTLVIPLSELQSPSK